MQQSKSAVRNKTRKTKQELEEVKVIKPKFQEERNPPPIAAKTPKQKEYFKMLADPDIQVIVCLGLAGTGKTFCASVVAADKFRKNEIQKIIVTRLS